MAVRRRAFCLDWLTAQPRTAAAVLLVLIGRQRILKSFATAAKNRYRTANGPQYLGGSYFLPLRHYRNSIGRVSNVTLCHEVPNFLFLFINFR